MESLDSSLISMRFSTIYARCATFVLFQVDRATEIGHIRAIKIKSMDQYQAIIGHETERRPKSDLARSPEGSHSLPTDYPSTDQPTTKALPSGINLDSTPASISSQNRPGLTQSHPNSPPVPPPLPQSPAPISCRASQPPPSISCPAPRPGPHGRRPHLFHHPQPCQAKVNKSLPRPEKFGRSQLREV
jgi:hypothetical protein